MSRITKDFKTETKDNIIHVATSLFGSKGFDQTKTKTIAQLCDIAEGTLFNYFPTKDDLLIAVFENMAKGVEMHKSDHLPNAIDRLIDLALDPIRQMHKIPKGLLVDLLLSSIKLAKKNPKLFHRLVALDLNYIDRLREKLEIYGNFHNKEINAKELGEMIYGVIVTDFVLYLYNKEDRYEDYITKVSPKLKALIKPYLKEAIQ